MVKSTRRTPDYKQTNRRGPMGRDCDRLRHWWVDRGSAAGQARRQARAGAGTALRGGRLYPRVSPARVTNGTWESITSARCRTPHHLCGRSSTTSRADGLQWNAMPDVYDRIRMGGHEYEFVAGLERFRDRLKSYFPRETAAIDRYLREVQSCARTTSLFFAEKAVPRPIARLAGPLMRAPFLRWARRTTGEVLSELTSNRELAGLLAAQWGDYGLPPGESSFAVHAIIAAHYFEGASFPVGGATSIAAGIAPAIEAAGGKIIFSADVSEILLDRSQRAVGVRMRDGREFRADMVISDAGAWNTFSRLLPPEAPGVAAAMAELKTVPPSMAHLCLYAGVKQSGAELGLTGTNLWIHPTLDHDANMARFASDPAAPLPLMFISSPSAKDPDFEQRHPGCATL